MQSLEEKKNSLSEVMCYSNFVSLTHELCVNWKSACYYFDLSMQLECSTNPDSN